MLLEKIWKIFKSALKSKGKKRGRRGKKGRSGKKRRMVRRRRIKKTLIKKGRRKPSTKQKNKPPAVKNRKTLRRVPRKTPRKTQRAGKRRKKPARKKVKSFPAKRRKHPRPQVKRPPKSPETFCAEVTHYFPRVRAAVLKIKSSLKIGDPVRVRGKHTDFHMTVGSLQIDRRPIQAAKKGQEVGCEVFKEVKPGDRLFLLK